MATVNLDVEPLDAKQEYGVCRRKNGAFAPARSYSEGRWSVSRDSLDTFEEAARVVVTQGTRAPTQYRTVVEWSHPIALQYAVEHVALLIQRKHETIAQFQADIPELEMLRTCYEKMLERAAE